MFVPTKLITYSAPFLFDLYLTHLLLFPPIICVFRNNRKHLLIAPPSWIFRLFFRRLIGNLILNSREKVSFGLQITLHCPYHPHPGYPSWLISFRTTFPIAATIYLITWWGTHFMLHLNRRNSLSKSWYDWEPPSVDEKRSIWSYKLFFNWFSMWYGPCHNKWRSVIEITNY